MRTRLALMMTAALMTATPAAAETPKVVSSAQAEKAAVDRDLKQYCTLMENVKGDVRHVPDADVAHQPIDGVELAPAHPSLPEKMEIPITFDMLQHMGVNVPAGMEGVANVAQVDVYLDGRVMYNGKDISGNLSGMCATIKAQDDAAEGAAGQKDKTAP